MHVFLYLWILKNPLSFAGIYVFRGLPWYTGCHFHIFLFYLDFSPFTVVWEFYNFLMMRMFPALFSCYHFALTESRVMMVKNEVSLAMTHKCIPNIFFWYRSLWCKQMPFRYLRYLLLMVTFTHSLITITWFCIILEFIFIS